jgi:hypothetical protein
MGIQKLQSLKLVIIAWISQLEDEKVKSIMEEPFVLSYLQKKLLMSP